jgi:hypothetical protein
LAAATIQDLLEFRDEEGSCLTSPVCYYFFSQDAEQSSTQNAAIRALISQILKQCGELESIQSAFALAYDEAMDESSKKELMDLMKITLSLLPGAAFVLDGVDECADTARLIQDLTSLVQRTGLKIIMFSRPNVICLRQQVTNFTVLPMALEALSKDISLYIREELESFHDAGLMPPIDSLELVITRLVERAEGVFLLARLMIVYLQSPASSPRRCFEIIEKGTPRGLQVM